MAPCQMVERCLSNSPSWIIDDTQNGLVVMLIGNDTKVGNKVFNLFMLIKLIATINLIGNRAILPIWREDLFSMNRAFNCTRERIGAIENSKVAPLVVMTLFQFDKPIDHRFCLGRLIWRMKELNEIALSLITPELFFMSLYVFSNDEVRGL